MSDTTSELENIIERVYFFGMNGGLGYKKFENELSPKEAEKAIQALTTAHTATLLDRVENEVVGRDGRIIKAVSPEHARQIYIVNLLRSAQRTALSAQRTALANLRKEYGCE